MSIYQSHGFLMASSEMSQEQKGHQYQKCNHWFPAQLKAEWLDLGMEISLPSTSLPLNVPSQMKFGYSGRLWKARFSCFYFQIYNSHLQKTKYDSQLGKHSILSESINIDQLYTYKDNLKKIEIQNNKIKTTANIYWALAVCQAFQ